MRERREEFRKAYYTELNKQGVMDSEKPVEKPKTSKKVKKEAE